LVFLGLMYCFAGVAFIADVFMAAIEKITSEKVRLKEGDSFRTYNVWNPTVANLTLMALGSSAPEILLSVIELISNGMHSGELGPSTIVGSAAFNLHVILAVCVVCIPAGELRSIKELPVFAITASFSVFAYLWLVFILLVSSPHVVEWWEGLLTFLFFPVLICFAYAADAGYLNKIVRSRGPDTNSKLVLTRDSTPQDKAEMVMQIRNKYGEGQNVLDFIEELIHYEFDPRPTRAQRRMQATREMFKGKPLPFAANKAHEKFGTTDPGAKALLQIAHKQSLPRDVPCHVEHSCAHYMVHESDRKVDCVITRTGDVSRPCKVHVKTVDGTAKAKDEYVAIDQDIRFNRYERSKTATIAIVEDTEYEDTEHFQLHLSIPPDYRRAVGLAQERVDTPGCDVASVLIFDNNHPGVLGFKDYDISMPEPRDAKKTLTVEVHRSKGTYGKVSCKYKTEDMTANEKCDYEPISGTLEFDHGEAIKTPKLNILPKVQGERTEQFRLIISDATGQATFDDSADGSDASCICTVIIKRDDPETRAWLGRLADVQALNADQLAQGRSPGGSSSLS